MLSKMQRFTVAAFMTLSGYADALRAEWQALKREAWADAVRFTARQRYGADRAQMGAGRAVNLVVALTVGGIVAAFLLPVALDEIVAVDTSNYSSGAQSLWDILDLIIVLAVFLFFIGLAMRRAP